MSDIISPKYQMQLIEKIDKSIWGQFESYKKVEFYIEKWHESDDSGYHENFCICRKDDSNIDLLRTLHSIDGELLLKIAIDLGIETPDFIPSIPTFRNEIKSSYSTASATFEKAFKEIEEHPDVAIGLANSALESIIKEIMKNDSIKNKVNSSDTLYKLAQAILKEFAMHPSKEIPQEIKTIGSSLLAVNQGIEKIRSEKTKFHGKHDDDYLVADPLYAYFVINSVTTVGLFLMSFYKKKFGDLVDDASQMTIPEIDPDDIPF